MKRTSYRHKFYQAQPVLHITQQTGLFFSHGPLENNTKAALWLLKNMNEYNPSYTYDTEVTHTKYMVNCITDIKPPPHWYWLEGPKNKEIDMDHPEWTYDRHHDGGHYCSGFFTDEISGAFNRNNIKEGDILTSQQKEHIEKTFCELDHDFGHDFPLPPGWTTAPFEETETVTKEYTTDQIGIAFIALWGCSLTVRHLLDTLTSTLKIHELSDELYDSIGLIKRHHQMNPPREFKCVLLRSCARDVRAHFSEPHIRKASLFSARNEIHAAIMNARAHNRSKATSAFHKATEPIFTSTASRPIVQAPTEPTFTSTAPLPTAPAPAAKSSAAEPTPTSIIGLSLERPVASPRFGKRSSSRSATPASLRSRAPTPTKDSCETPSSSHGGVQQTPWIAGGFDYQNWSTSRTRRLPLNDSGSQATGRSRGTYDDYLSSQRFSFLATHRFSSRRRLSGKRDDSQRKTPNTQLFSATKSKAHPGAVSHGPPKSAHVVTPIDPTSPPSTPEAASRSASEEAFLLHDSFCLATGVSRDLYKPPSEPKTDPDPATPTPTPAETTKPDSRFELPPTDHPAFPSAFGSYHEYHEHGDQVERHGYEFYGDYMAEGTQPDSASRSSASHSNDSKESYSYSPESEGTHEEYDDDPDASDQDQQDDQSGDFDGGPDQSEDDPG